MFKLLFQSLIAALSISDTNTALTLLQDNQTALLEPLEGPMLHAEALFLAIKKANIPIIRYLLNLPVSSDLSFYNYCGYTPISLVLKEGLNELVPDFLKRTDKNFALHTAVKSEDKPVIDLLLKNCIYTDRFLQYLGVKR